MRFSIFWIATLIPTVSSAAGNCPADTKQVYVCKSTPQNGDGILASEYFTGIDVCSGGNDIVRLVLFAGSSFGIEAATKSETIGGVNYTVASDNVTLTLAISTAINPKVKPSARLYLNVAGIKTDSTYACIKKR